VDPKRIIALRPLRPKLLILLLAIFLLAGGSNAVSGSSQPQDYLVKAQNEAWPAIQSLAAPACNLIFQEIPQKFFSLILTSTPDVHRFAASSLFEAGKGNPAERYIGIGRPKDRVSHEAQLKRWANLSLLVVAALLVLALLWMVRQKLFSKPVNRVVMATPRFGMAELDTSVGLPQTSEGLGPLAQFFAPGDLEPGVRERPAELRQTGAELHLGIDSHLATQESPVGSEERFRSLVENIDLGITLISPDYRIIMSNPALGALLQKQVGEIIGKECFREFENRETVCPYCPGTIAMATGQKAEAETHWGRDDGSNFPVRVQAFPRFGPDGQINGFIEVVEDSSQGKQVRKALETEPLILRDILEDTLAGYWDWDIPNNREYLSPTFKKMFGYEDHELPNSPETWQRLIFPEDLPGVLEVFKQHVESRGAVPYYNEVRYRHKDGSTIWVICAGRVIEWDAAGQPRRMVGCHVDITERKRAEEALRKSAEEIQDLYNRAPCGHHSLNADGVFVQINETELQWLGYNRDEIVGKKRFTEVISKRSLETFHDNFPQFKVRGWVRDLEFEMVRKDGTILPVLLSASAVTDPDGHYVMSRSTVYDITEPKRAEEALRESEARYHAIVEGFDGLIYMCSQDYRVEFMNYKFISRTGYDATGELCYQALHGLDSICPWCVNERVFKGETVRWEVKSPKDDRWFYIVNVPIYHSDGTMSKQSMIQDITERKRAEEALRQAHETLRATLDAAPVAILDLDREGRVKSLWNPAAEKMLGWRRDEVLGRYLPSIPEDSKEERDRFRKWARSGRPILGKDVVRRRKDGSLIEYSIYAAPEYDARGKVMGNIAVLVDITERKRAEEAIKLNEARLAGLLRISQYQAESIQELLNYALEEAIALTASKMGFIYLFDDNSQQLTLNTWSSEVKWESTITDPQTIYRLEDIGIWGEAVRQGRPMVVNDFLASHPLQEGYPAGQAPHKFLTIPVFANKRIVAVVGVAKKAADYDEADVLQLTLMMDAVWKIVERRQAEEELQAAAHKWQTTFDAITDAVFLLDPEGTILQCNQALADLVQKPFADILGRPCCKVVHGTSQPIPGCPLMRMRQTRQREIMVLPRGDRWFNLGVDPILDESSNLVGAVHIMSDVTQLTEAERSLYRRTQDLTILNTIGSIMSRSLDLSKVLGGSLQMIQQNMFDGKSRAIIFLLDEATGELKATGQRGFPEDHPCLGRPLQMDKCLCGRAALSGKIVFSWRGCADCASGFPTPDTTPRQDIGLPLKVQDRLLGVMHLSLSPDQEVDERHLKLLEAIAAQISVAVEKARLFEQVNLQGTQLRTLSARLAEIEEAERKAMARELHDHVGQSLTTLSLYLTMLQEQLPRMLPEKAQSRLTDALTLVEETADSVREIMAELRPPVLDDFGLMAAARWFGKQFSQRTGISLQATGEDPEPRLDRKVEMGLFRILQEALNNVAKHARASLVTVTEEVWGDKVRFTIADNGIGFDITQVGRPEGRHRWGLMNMSERALAAGGTCRVDSQPGQGTRVIVEVNR
jgi:PAS domain S-box-containing protein